MKPEPGRKQTENLEANLDQLKMLMMLRSPVESRRRERKEHKPLNISKTKLEKLKANQDLGDALPIASPKYLARKSLAIEEAENLPRKTIKSVAKSVSIMSKALLREVNMEPA